MRVAIYARYSSDNQRDASMADQMRVCQLITHFFSPNGDPRATPPEAGAIRVTWENSRDRSRVWAFLLQQSSDAKFVQKDAVPWLLLQSLAWLRDQPAGTGKKAHTR
jgi:hypothetical protein